MASATDIITYIGIPLAVLGVLPILYTFVFSILTQRRIRSLLISHGHRPHTNRSSNEQEGFMLRSSPMTSLIEVEMPRYTIAPVDRENDKYWDVDRTAVLSAGFGHGHAHANEGAHLVERVESTLSMMEEGRVRGFLRGGSWRTFHWRRLVVGRKLYRVQYMDELREPPAEIEFSELVHFLMDWGAELDGTGWGKLRSGGLWTPSGTVLLRIGSDNIEEEIVKANGASAVTSRTHSRSGGHGDWVLRTSMPDDSDGILTLCVRWPSEQNSGSVRNSTNLPPGWGRLQRPTVVDQAHETENTKNSLSSTITTLARTTKAFHDYPSFRFRLESGLITTIYTESRSDTQTKTSLPLSTLSHHPSGLDWFTAATTSLLTLSKPKSKSNPITQLSTGSLWGHTLPPHISSFLPKDSIPIGLLVLLDLLDATSAPHWDTTASLPNMSLDMAHAHHSRFQARLAAERLEATMPPDQARVHKANRELQERRAQMDESMNQLAQRRQRDEKRLNDAIVSARVGITVVVDCAVKWLIANNVVDVEATPETIVEAVLYLMILETQTTDREDHPTTEKSTGDSGTIDTLKDGISVTVFHVLDEWMKWTAAGGMKKDQVEMLDRHKREFCLAACVVAVVHGAAGVETGVGRASLDMLECLGMWRKVRLG